MKKIIFLLPFFFSILSYGQSTIFYPDLFKIHKVNSDGTNHKEIVPQVVMQQGVFTTSGEKDKIWWISNGKINQTNLRGGELKTFDPGNIPVSLDFDETTDYLYWTTSDSEIWRRELGSSNNELFLELDEGELAFGKLDFKNQKLYWYSSSSGELSSVNFDGTDVTAIRNIKNEFGSLQTLEIDVDNERIYFAGLYEVFSIDYMGSDLRTLSNSNTGTNRNLTLDSKNGKIYFTNYFGTDLYEMDLDGSNMVTYPFGDQNEALSISKDVVNNTVYAYYFSGEALVRQINLDNQEVSDVFLKLTRPSGIAFDYNTQKMFWTDYEEGTLNSADIDGSNQKLLRDGPRLLMDVFFDSLNNKIIMMGDNKFIHELNPDGSSINLFLRNTIGGIEDFTFAFANEKMYWIDKGNGNINRANRNGTGAAFFIQNLNAPNSLTVNQTTGKLYWTDSNTIYRCDLDGSNQETLGAHQGLGTSRMAIDEVEEKIYWFNSFDKSIYRSNLLGQNIEKFLQTDASTAFPMRIGIYNPNINSGPVDADMDGFTSDEDCDDTNAAINPDAIEIPNNDIDEDCDGVALIIDADMDGFNSDEDCDDSNAAINPDATEIPNNNIDENCDGIALIIDADMDGFNSDEDCDDSNAAINPNATEIPNNNIDENCDGIALIIDADMDGFNSDEDCDDSNAAINPDAMEIPDNGIDEDCDGMDATSSLNEISGRVIKLFPNPASEFVVIQIAGLTTRQIDVEVFDLSGKLVGASQIHQGSTMCHIDTRTFYAGEYFARLSEGNKKGLVRFSIIK